MFDIWYLIADVWYLTFGIYCLIFDISIMALAKLFKSKTAGDISAAEKIPKTSPLECLLAHWGELHDDLRKSQIIEYCNHWWPL